MRHRLCLAACLIAVLRVAWAQDSAAPPSVENGRIERTGFSVPSFPGTDWKVPRNPVLENFPPTDLVMFELRNADFVRHSAQSRDAQPAFVGIQLMRTTKGGIADTQEGFVRSVDEDLRGAVGPGGTLVDLKIAPSTFKGADCVRYEAITEGRVGPGLFASTARSFAQGFFCRHPSSPLTVVIHGAIRSTRYRDWSNIDAKGEEEAKAFLDSIEFVPLPKEGG